MTINILNVIGSALSLVASMLCAKSADRETSLFWKAFDLLWAFEFVLLFFILLFSGLGVKTVW